MRCPLPIDWLDHLEGRPVPELAAHLADCVSCRVLVEELRRDLPSRSELRPQAVPDSTTWPAWAGAKARPARFGEIWWTSQRLGTPSESTGRILLLILSDLWEEERQSWCDVVPLSTDIENATSVDFLLSRGDTDVQVPWRVCFRFQTVARPEALDTRIGALTASGYAEIQRVLAGVVDVERFGSPIDGEHDPRARSSTEMEQLIRLIAAPYAALEEHDDAKQESGAVIVFPMIRTKGVVDTAHQFKLAAASERDEELPQWEVDIPKRGRIQGRLVRSSEDELFFVVETVSESSLGLGSSLSITFWSELLATPATSVTFVPVVGTRVPLGRDFGVFPSEISRLEVRLADAS